MTVDPAAAERARHRAAELRRLERRVTEFTDPPPSIPESDWRGPAADAYRGRLHRLVRELRYYASELGAAADVAAQDVVRAGG